MADRLDYDPQVAYLGSYAATIAHFVACLASGAAFETSPQDNLETLRLVEDTLMAPRGTLSARAAGAAGAHRRHGVRRAPCDRGLTLFSRITPAARRHDEG